MNKHFVMSVVALFIMSMILGFIVHGTLLHADYVKLQHLFRGAEETEYLPYMLAAHLSIAIGMTWIYRQGRDNRPWLGQGIRFGLAVTVLATIPMYLIYYAVQPMPSDLVAKQIIFDAISMVILGILAAVINRDAIAARIPAHP
ncbi:MAG TPA: hypothetical protein VM073_12175 [Usitatibacter sp.]|nr:hypothetical protein [Usitatibacter sp.]